MMGEAKTPSSKSRALKAFARSSSPSMTGMIGVSEWPIESHVGEALAEVIDVPPELVPQVLRFAQHLDSLEQSSRVRNGQGNGHETLPGIHQIVVNQWLLGGNETTHHRKGL